MAKKESNAKVIWYILFAFITCILCYMFVVVYFYFITPNNISTKIAVWPFLSDQTIGEMYLDVTMEIKFEVYDESSMEDVEKTVVGVNVREDGYILAPYHEFRSCTSDTVINILANSGKVYAGKLLYSDINYNIAVLKCENIEGDEEIKIPFVTIKSTTNTSLLEENVLAIASPLKSKNVWKGTITDFELTNVYKEMEVEGKNAVDFVLENCYMVELEEGEGYTGGAVFDKRGGLMGLSFKETTEDGSYVIMPIDIAKEFIDEVVDNYEKNTQYTNDLVSSFVGFDKIEIACYIDASSENESSSDYFYFNNQWQHFSDDVLAYSHSDYTGYYLFDDFVYGGETLITNSNVISYAEIDGNSFDVDIKTDLFGNFYQLQKGDELTIYYFSIQAPNEALKSVTFVV